MRNMRHCRFRNTLIDLRDCYRGFGDSALSDLEAEARDRIYKLCQKIVLDFDPVKKEAE